MIREEGGGKRRESKVYLEGKRRSRAEGCVQGRRRAGEPMAVKKSSVLVIFTQSSESRLSTW